MLQPVCTIKSLSLLDVIQFLYAWQAGRVMPASLYNKGADDLSP
jgi:hypothetical protein